MKYRTDLTAELVRRLLDYDQETGALTWKDRPDIPPWLNDRSRGKKAGWTDRKGYTNLQINGGCYFAHRIIWLWMTGEWPDEQVDHRLGDKADNRWVALRAATHSQNASNRKAKNGDGLPGAHKHSRRGWQSEIRVNNKRIYLGFFSTAEAAHKAYVEAAKRLHGGYTRTPESMRRERETASA
jgi:hypothetical protein